MLFSPTVHIVPFYVTKLQTTECGVFIFNSALYSWQNSEVYIYNGHTGEIQDYFFTFLPYDIA